MTESNTILVRRFTENPRQFIVDIQDVIESVILGFVRTGKFGAGEKKEVQQQVNEVLLNRIGRIAQQYKGNAQIKTYFIAIVRNICNDLVRQRVRMPVLISLDHTVINSGNNATISRLLIAEESARLEKIINLYYKQKDKLRLCLRLKYRMLYSFEDFTDYNGSVQQTDYACFNRMVEPYPECTDQKIFTALSIVFNTCERQGIEPDSLRKWVNTKISELIEILNEYPHSSNYNEDTLQLLFEYSYCGEFEKQKSKINLMG